ncbi:MAG: hypothetical protein IKV29_00425 [Alistipes sp.]|nr:hypothetical protein [Alistipes sp.]
MKRFTIFMLTLLGYSFVSCDPNERAEIDTPMYGAPMAEYQENPLVDETLTQESNNDPQNE